VAFCLMVQRVAEWKGKQATLKIEGVVLTVPNPGIFLPVNP